MRRFLHRKVADALQTTFAADLDPVSAQVAVHLKALAFRCSHCGGFCSELSTSPN